jgi:hypothetical protein
LFSQGTHILAYANRLLGRLESDYAIIQRLREQTRHFFNVGNTPLPDLAQTFDLTSQFDGLTSLPDNS